MQLRLITSVSVLVLALAASCAMDVETVGEQSAALGPVTWTNVVGVTATGNDLLKVGINAWDSGAVSVETLSGTGYMEFTTAESNRYKAAGLSNGDSSQHYNDIDYAFYLMNSGSIRIYEGGANRGTFGTYVAGDVFRVEVVGGAVRYLQNGTLLYTSLVAPTFPLLIDTSLYTNNATVNDVVIENSTWANVVNVAIADNDIQKTAGGTGWNAGASSIESLSGDGFVDFVANGSNAYRIAGLSNGDSTQNYTDVDFGVYLMTAGRVRIYEGGVNRGDFGTYSSGDVFRVQATAGVVTYYRNGGLLYTSGGTPTFPLLVDTAFYTNLSRIDDITLGTAPFWMNVVGASAVGNDLVKTGTTVGWNGGAASVDSIAGDGYMEFTTAETNKYKMAGLSNGDTDQHYNDIDFGFYLMSQGRIRIYESGLNRGDFGTYAANDVFRVQNTGGVITYYQNGLLLYASLGTATSPLLADTSLYTLGSTVQNVVLSP